VLQTYDVFVSYSRTDQALAGRLNDWLRAQGVRTFYDRHELAPGLPWVTALERAIDASASVAVLVGPQGIGNTQQYEVELALVRQAADRSFPVVPVLLPGCDNPPIGFLQLLTWADLRSGSDGLDCPAELQAMLAAIRREPVGTAAIRGTICPYMGLEAFREQDAPFYCGRDNVIADLVGKVGDYPFVAVVGRSGSGKSSVVEAGLLPALRRQYKATVWDAVSFKPGAWPLQSLATCFNAGVAATGVFATDTAIENEVAALRQGDADQLVRVIAQRLAAMPEQPDRLLIHVDQWEELYSRAPPADQPDAHARHEADVARFIDLLLAASEGVDARARIVITVRVDFYGQLIRPSKISALLPRQQVNLGPMSREDLRAAIVRPAEKVGLKFTPSALVDRILDDVGLDERMLPLLQYALKETWARREQGALTASGYAASGGVEAAIRITAQQTFDALSPAEQAAAKRLFLGLVIPGEGREDTRTHALIPDDPLLRSVVGKFADRKARLLVTGSESAPGNEAGAIAQRPTVEITHEALIRSWPTLQAWVRESRAKLRARADVLRAMRQWEANGQRDDLLLQPGFQLEMGRDLLAAPGEVPVDDLRPYIDASSERDERLSRERAEREQSELRRELEFRRRQARTRSIVFGVVSSAAVVCLMLAGVALWQMRSAIAQQNEAQARGLWSRLDLSSAQGMLTDSDLAGLWELAAAPPAIQAQFVADLRSNPLAYVARLQHASLVFSALRLVSGSPMVAELLEPLLDLLQSPNLPAPASAGILGVLAPSLTEAQGDRAFNALLARLPELTDDPDSGVMLRITTDAGRWTSDDLASRLLAIGLDDLRDPAERARWARGVARLGVTDAKPAEALAGFDWCLQELVATKDVGRGRMLMLGAVALAQLGDAGAATHLADGLIRMLVRAAAEQPRNDTPMYEGEPAGNSVSAEVLQALAQELRHGADQMPTADIGARIGPVVGLVRAVIDQPAQRMLLDTLRVMVGRLDPGQALEAYGAVQAELIKPSDRGNAPPFYLLRDAIAGLAAKLPPTDIDRELATRMRSLSAGAASLPPMPGYNDPPARQAEYWDRRDQIQTLAMMAAGLAGAAPPGTADSFIDTLRLRLHAPIVLPDIYYLVAAKLRDPGAVFDAALAEVARPVAYPARDQTPDQAPIAAAIARALPPAGAGNRIDTVIALLEAQRPESPARRQLADMVVQCSDKLSPADAARRFDRLVQDLSTSNDAYALFDFAQAAIALAHRLDPADADPRLLHLLEITAQVPSYPGVIPNQGYIPIHAFAVVTAGVAKAADPAGAAAALSSIGAMLAKSPSYQSRTAFSQVAAELTDRLDAATRLSMKPVVLYALQRSQRPLETVNWTHALVPILKAEAPEAFAADLVEVWKYPNASDTVGELFVALHAARADSPDIKVGASGYLKWIAKLYPSIDITAPPAWLAAPAPLTDALAGR
jgi:hypothetical protein